MRFSLEEALHPSPRSTRTLDGFARGKTTAEKNLFALDAVLVVVAPRMGLQVAGWVTEPTRPLSPTPTLQTHSLHKVP